MINTRVYIYAPALRDCSYVLLYVKKRESTEKERKEANKKKKKKKKRIAG